MHIIPVSDDGVKLDNGLLFGLGEFTVLEIRAEVVGPAEPATLAAPLKAGVFGNESPITRAVLSYVGRELVVFFRSPLPSLHVVLLAAWNPPHFSLASFVKCLQLNFSFDLIWG